MELAGRVFDIISDKNNILDTKINEAIPELDERDKLPYWRRVIRMAALFHDVGHIPFSHASEQELLPQGYDHETFTRAIIENDILSEMWNKPPPLRPTDIVKLAVGPKRLKNIYFTNWESILSEVISGDCFGVDRIDYLLRDSHHAGVAYGKFDHYRLIDTLRILPSHKDVANDDSAEPTLGVEEGGLHSAEALLIARYFMFQQIYFHPVRRIYDIHLKDFLKEWLPNGEYPTDIHRHLNLTDNEVMSALLKASRDSNEPGHAHARRITERKHYKLLYQPSPDEPEATKMVFEAAQKQYGNDVVRIDEYAERGGPPDFPVYRKDGRISSAYHLSYTLQKLPVARLSYIFISPDKRKDAQKWLQTNKNDILRKKRCEEN
jgi:hypothetical protein